jgi:predicted transcriptional regulator
MPSDAVQFLANSPERLTLLRTLSEAPSSPSDIASNSSASRRSIQRNLSEFVDRGWAASNGGTYRLTVTGALVAEEHATYVDTLDHIDDFAPFFRHLPSRDSAPEPAWLADATLTVTTPEDPQAPVHRYVTSVKQFDTDRVQMLSPVLSRLFHEAHASLAVRGVHTDLVMSTPTVARARERNPLEFRAVVALGVLTLYQYPDPFRIGLTLGDDRLLMAAYDETKQLQALVESQHPQFHAWASELFDSYRRQSTLVER